MQASKLSNLKTSSISKQISVTKVKIFKLRKIKSSHVWGNDKCISTFWKKGTFNFQSWINKNLGKCLMNPELWKKKTRNQKNNGPTMFVYNSHIHYKYMRPEDTYIQVLSKSSCWICRPVNMAFASFEEKHLMQLLQLQIDISN